MEGLSFWTALGAGLASFLSPCILPLVPVYLASLAGPGLLETGNYDRKKLLFASLSFVAGFGLLFTLAGALVGLAGFSIGPGSMPVRIVSGVVLVVLGALMLLALKIPALNYEKRLSLRIGTGNNYLRPALIGGSFALAWTPCLSPILGGILMLAFSSATALQGAYLLAVYSIGLGIPFLILGLAFSTLFPVVRAMKKYTRVVYIISGMVLVAIGILILTGNLEWLYY